jgi:HAD superfamily hydrolase (TIGR01490 family)
LAVAFFDLDGTLLDVNSGRLWIAYEWRDGRVSVRDAAWATYVLARYTVGYGELDPMFRQAVATLAGQEEAALADRTRRWFASEVVHRLRPGAEQALQEHRAAGDRLVLATSSSLYAAGEAVAAYGLDEAVCSLFEVVDGRFTGQVAASAFGSAKADRVGEWADRNRVDLRECTFYTDSSTDLALLEIVGQPVVVNPDRRLRGIAAARRWPVVDWGTRV